MSKPTLDGEVITLANAKTLVLKRFPRARCDGQTDNSGQRDYFVYRGQGPRAGEMYLAYGKTKPAAWKAAAVEIASAKKTP